MKSSTNEAGAYAVIVSNAEGSVTSVPVQLMVTEGPAHGSLLLEERFAYPDGILTEVSAGRWSHHSGLAGEVQVAQEALSLSQTGTEDVSARLIGGPYAPDAAAVLYARFTFCFTQLPGGLNGNYFAHFKSTANVFRGRIFATTNGAASGFYRLGIASGADKTTDCCPVDLPLNAVHTAVLRLGVSTAAATLWVDPKAEADASVSSSDSATPGAIAAFAFRQSLSSGNGIGALTVDDLAVGLAFADVVAGTPVEETITGLVLAPVDDRQIRLRWTATPGRSYTIWRAERATAPWVSCAENVCGDEHGVEFVDNVGMAVQSYYRVSSP